MRRKFKPCAYWNRPGRQVEIYLEPQMYVAHWVTPWFTAYIDPKTKKLIGMDFPTQAEARRVAKLMQQAIRTLGKPAPKMTKKEREDFDLFLRKLTAPRKEKR